MRKHYWYKAAVAAGAIITGLGMAGSSAAAAATNPPMPTPFASPTSGPHWHPAHGQRAPIDVTVTNPARGCLTLYKTGGTLSAKATHITSGRGQVVTSVTFNAIDPGGVTRTSHTAYKVNSDEWHASMTLAANSGPGNWTLVATVNYAGTDSASIKYADTYFCVKRNSYSGYIHSTNNHPAIDQRYTLTAGIYGLSSSGKSYVGLPHRKVHVWFAPTSGGPGRYLGWAEANNKGIWSLITTGQGQAGNIIVVYPGGGDYNPFISQPYLEGVTTS